MKRNPHGATSPLPEYLLRDHCDGRIVGHRLGELSWFSDEGLTDLIDHHDAKHRLVTTMGFRPEHPSEHQVGCWDDSSDWLGMLRAGRLEMTLRGQFEKSATERVVRRLVQEFMERFPEDRAADWDARVIAASPQTLTYLSYTTEHTLWLQIRGQRTVWIYPSEPPFVSQRVIEDISLGNRVDTLYFEPAFDDHASRLELEPGQSMVLPPRTPFRTTCGSELNVAMSVSIATSRSRRADRQTVVRGWLRRNLPIDVDGVIGSLVTGAAAGVSGLVSLPRGNQKARDRRAHDRQVDVSFCVDPDAPRGVGPMRPPKSTRRPPMPVNIQTNPTPVSAMEN